jgi:hypothetical protein|tara:strand:+ start:1336 stop:1872 length:537 start_codon:yes stop_codon:yes gene_type:complete
VIDRAIKPTVKDSSFELALKINDRKVKNIPPVFFNSKKLNPNTKKVVLAESINKVNVNKFRPTTLLIEKTLIILPKTISPKSPPRPNGLLHSMGVGLEEAKIHISAIAIGENTNRPKALFEPICNKNLIPHTVKRLGIIHELKPTIIKSRLAVDAPNCPIMFLGPLPLDESQLESSAL